MRVIVSESSCTVLVASHSPGNEYPWKYLQQGDNRLVRAFRTADAHLWEEQTRSWGASRPNLHSVIVKVGTPSSGQFSKEQGLPDSCLLSCLRECLTVQDFPNSHIPRFSGSQFILTSIHMTVLSVSKTQPRNHPSLSSIVYRVLLSTQHNPKYNHSL